MRAGPDRRPLLPVAVAVASSVVLVWAAIAGAELRRPGSGVVDGLFVSEAHDGHLALHGRHAVTAEDQGWGPAAVRGVLDSDVAVHVPEPSRRDPARRRGRPVYASWGIGVVGYTLGEDVYVLDMLGLADPLVSRFALERPGATGHEKPIPAAWLAAPRVRRPGARGPAAPAGDEHPPLRVATGAAGGRRRGGTASAGVRRAGGPVGGRARPAHTRALPPEPRRVPGADAPAVPADPHEAETRFCG